MGGDIPQECHRQPCLAGAAQAPLTKLSIDLENKVVPSEHLSQIINGLFFF